ncbi:MAG TPA: hypothetical protein VNS63_27270 [Blastocatellia bacterium]|nr:hypothetical protein [Blastocatellia bacterium]
MSYRIQRSVKKDAIMFAISGEMDIENTERLRGLLEMENHSHILLDLSDVTLVGRDAVEFLAGVEAAGVGIVNCPDYVRRWIVAVNLDRRPA